MSWYDDNCPKVGWTNTDMIDLGDDRELCEMCERQWIRFVHVMEHPEHNTEVRSGCICAGKMEADADAATKRESRLKQIAKAHEFEPEWRTASTGSYYFKHKGWFGCIYLDRKTGTMWKTTVSFDNGKPSFGKKGYADIDEAKLACTAAFINARVARWKELDAGAS
jgi:hypothetical protein